MRLHPACLALALALAASSCDQGRDYPIPDDPNPGGDVTGPTAEQLSTVSDFVTVAIAGDDFCAALESADSSFTVRLFSGGSVTIPVHIDVIPEGGSTAGLENYVVDGTRYAEFNLGGETQSLPSDIHQWYNPPLPTDADSLSVLCIGGEFTEDATMMLPQMSAGTGSTVLSFGRLLRDGASLRGLLSDGFAYSEALNGASEWSGASSSSLADALSKRSWDVVTLMENPMSADGWSCDSSALAAVGAAVDTIFKACRHGRPSVLLMLGPELPSSHTIVTDNFGGDSRAMYDAIISYGRGAVSGTVIDDVVSVGTAIRNLRASEVAEASTNGLTCDGTRLDRGAGCFTAASTVFAKTAGACVGFKLSANSYVPNKSSSEEGAIATGVSNAFLPICRNAAEYAVTSPFDTVDLAALRTKMPSDGIPDAGYIDSGILFEADTTGGGEEDGKDTVALVKTLTFDFATLQDGLMPASALAPSGMNARFNVTMRDLKDGKSYKFYNAGGVYHGTSNAYTTIYDGKGTGYLGLPAVEGYKLTRISNNRGAATGATVSLEVLSDVASATVAAGPFTWTKGKAATDDIILPGTRARATPT